MITPQCHIELLTSLPQLRLEGRGSKDLKKELQFSINYRYIDDVVIKAQSVINAYKELKMELEEKKEFYCI